MIWFDGKIDRKTFIKIEDKEKNCFSYWIFHDSLFDNKTWKFIFVKQSLRQKLKQN